MRHITGVFIYLSFQEETSPQKIISQKDRLSHILAFSILHALKIFSRYTIPHWRFNFETF